jgi:hypothetical protein
LKKNRDERYATISELARDLTELAPRRAQISLERISGVLRRAGMLGSVTETSLEPSQPLDLGPREGTQASWGRTTPPPRRHKLGLLGAGATLAIALFVYALWPRTAVPVSPALTASAPVTQSLAASVSPSSGSARASSTVTRSRGVAVEAAGPPRVIAESVASKPSPPATQSAVTSQRRAVTVPPTPRAASKSVPVVSATAPAAVVPAVATAALSGVAAENPPAKASPERPVRSVFEDRK